jgi:putative transposase
VSERIYHVWFGTKLRIPALQGDIERDARQLFQENAVRAGVRLIEAETAIDHVHLIVGVPDDKNLSSAMHQIKGATSRAVFLKYPELKSDMSQTALWQKGYSYRLIESDGLPATRGYVRTQEHRSLRHD